MSVLCSLQAFPGGFLQFQMIGHHITLGRSESCPHPPRRARFLVALPGQSLGGGQPRAGSVAAERTAAACGSLTGEAVS